MIPCVPIYFNPKISRVHISWLVQKSGSSNYSLFFEILFWWRYQQNWCRCHSFPFSSSHEKRERNTESTVNIHEMGNGGWLIISRAQWRIIYSLQIILQFEISQDFEFTFARLYFGVLRVLRVRSGTGRLPQIYCNNPLLIKNKYANNPLVHIFILANSFVCVKTCYAWVFVFRKKWSCLRLCDNKHTEDKAISGNRMPKYSV